MFGEKILHLFRNDKKIPKLNEKSQKNPKSFIRVPHKNKHSRVPNLYAKIGIIKHINSGGFPHTD